MYSMIFQYSYVSFSYIFELHLNAYVNLFPVLRSPKLLIPTLFPNFSQTCFVTHVLRALRASYSVSMQAKATTSNMHSNLVRNAIITLLTNYCCTKQYISRQRMRMISQVPSGYATSAIETNIQSRNSDNHM